MALATRFYVCTKHKPSPEDEGSQGMRLLYPDPRQAQCQPSPPWATLRCLQQPDGPSGQGHHSQPCQGTYPPGPGDSKQLQGRAWMFEVAMEMVSLEGREGTGNENTAWGRCSSTPKGSPNQAMGFHSPIPQNPSPPDPPALGPQLALIAPCTSIFPAN